MHFVLKNHPINENSKKSSGRIGLIVSKGLNNKPKCIISPLKSNTAMYPKTPKQIKAFDIPYGRAASTDKYLLLFIEINSIFLFR